MALYSARFIWVWVLFVLCVSACQPVRPESEIPPSPTETASGQFVMVRYHKKGCFAGVDNTLTIHADGRLEFVDRNGKQSSASVSPNELEKLRQMLASEEFSSLNNYYPAVGSDLCVYEITVVVEGSERTVTTMDAAQHPQFLQDVIGELERLARRV